MRICLTKILKAQPERNGRQFIFGDGPRGIESEKHAGFQGWSKAKAALDKRTSVVPAWRLHDLRRRVSTCMADLGVQPHIIEAVLNHASGHKGGIAGVNNRAAYLEQKRAALKLWAKNLGRTVLTESAFDTGSLHF
jgi:hypothetical protein